jgi:hypothetical protein
LKPPFQKAREAWPVQFLHRHGKRTKAISDQDLRYQVGTERLALLRDSLFPLAYRLREDGSWVLAFAAEFDELDRDFRMNEDTRCEYVVVEVTAQQAPIAFAYYWLKSKSEAKKVALNHHMTILPEQK